MASKLQIHGISLLMSALFTAGVSAQATGPIVIFNCSGQAGQSISGELPLALCPNNQYTNYASTYEYVLGPSCDSTSTAPLGNISDTLSVKAHFTLLKENSTNIVRKCVSALYINNPVNGSIIATTWEGNYTPQNCGQVLESGSILRYDLNTSTQGVNCSFTFDLSVIGPTPTIVPAATMTPTRTITPSRTATRTATPLYSGSSSSAMPTPTRTPTRTYTPTPYTSSSSAQSSSASSGPDINSIQ